MNKLILFTVGTVGGGALRLGPIFWLWRSNTAKNYNVQ